MGPPSPSAGCPRPVAARAVRPIGSWGDDHATRRRRGAPPKSLDPYYHFGSNATERKELRPFADFGAARGAWPEKHHRVCVPVSRCALWAPSGPSTSDDRGLGRHRPRGTGLLAPQPRSRGRDGRGDGERVAAGRLHLRPPARRDGRAGLRGRGPDHLRAGRGTIGWPIAVQYWASDNTPNVGGPWPIKSARSHSLMARGGSRCGEFPASWLDLHWCSVATGATPSERSRRGLRTDAR